jgi:ribosomal protein S18 acetylase RimI-like enzyme
MSNRTKPHRLLLDKQLLIRRAEIGDIPAIVAMVVALAVHEGEPIPNLTEETLQRDALGENPACRLWVAEIQTTHSIIAFIMTTPGYDLATATRGTHLGDIFVHPEWRGQGVAHQLLSTAAEGEWMSFTVLASNAQALAFYRTLGAVEREDVKFMALALE